MQVCASLFDAPLHTPLTRAHTPGLLEAVHARADGDLRFHTVRTMAGLHGRQEQGQLLSLLLCACVFDHIALGCRTREGFCH